MRAQGGKLRVCLWGGEERPLVLLEGIAVQPIEHVCLLAVALLIPYKGMIVSNLLQPEANLRVGAELVSGAVKCCVQDLHSGVGGDETHGGKPDQIGCTGGVIVRPARQPCEASLTSICAAIDSAVSRPAE